ncbi:MAG: zinc-binding dehydrogenase, partial [Chloroflexota bacterium]
DIADYRLQAARHFGADEAVLSDTDVPSRLRQLNEGRLANVVILCTGAVPAILQALQCVERGGTILFFAPTLPGVTIPLAINDLFWRNEVSLITSYAASPADYRAALEMLRMDRERLREMVTHRLGLAEIEQGFQLVAAAQDSIKVVIEPQR